MKTNYRRIQTWIALSIVVIGMASCVTNYKMTTTIRPDGSCLREIYAQGDSAFLAGNPAKNPYLFYLDSGWQITPVATENVPDRFGNEYNVKVSKTFRSIGEIASGLQLDEDVRPVAAPVESFQKHFRWFYTYYSFKAVYPDISAKIPVSIDNYLNKSEQKLWFQGDFSAYAGMNGIELKDEMDNIEKEFWKWYARNIFESNFEAVYDFEKLSGNNPYISQIQSVKDTLFQALFKNFMSIDNQIETADIYQALDKNFKTNYFSNSYKNNQQPIDRLVETKEEPLKKLIENLFDKEIEYELVIPGKLIYANTSVNRQDTLIWKVNAFRFTTDDYELVAESRTVHIWAFGIAFLLLALSIYCFVKAKRV
ncbi:hypothetical protein FACS189423_09400 [Bacteroidia bacterium]|nr:hypothetical protein FACS189423_09400 [Bacteroidia bacterium]